MKAFTYIAITAAAMVAYIALEYIIRGYFAIGAEIMFPMAAVAIAAVKAE